MVLVRYPVSWQATLDNEAKGKINNTDPVGISNFDIFVIKISALILTFKIFY